MERSLFTSVALTVAMLSFCALMLFNTCQVNHLQQHVIASTNEVQTLQRAVSRMQNQIESGAIATRAGGASGGAGSDHPQARHFAPEEWEALMRPGNLLVPSSSSLWTDETVEGGTLRRAFITDMPGLNPLTNNAADVSELYSYVSESLASQQRDDISRWTPGLAYRIEANADYTEYRVFLKRGVRYHRPAVDFSDPRYAWLQEEREVVADDFVFFLELATNPQVDAAHLRNYYEDVEGIEVVNDHEFIVRWSTSTYHSLVFTFGMSPMPRWLYGADAYGEPYDEAEVGRRFNGHWFNQRAIGTGPYRFVRWQQGGSIILERYDQYHGELPPIERIEFQVIRDETGRLNNLRAGELDFTDIQPTQYRNEIVQGGTRGFASGELEYETYQGLSYRYIGWNMDTPFFEDRRVRLAMTHAMNRQQMLDVNMEGLGRVISGPFFIDSDENDASIEPWPFDLERAGQLLTEAGWEDLSGDGIRERIIDGRPVRFDFRMMVYGHRPEFIAAMESYRNDLRRIGVRMTIQPVEWSIMLQRMYEKDFEAFTGGWVLSAALTDPYQIWHSSQADVPRGSNRVGFRNPEADALIEQLRVTFDRDERIRMLHRFHAIVHEEQPYTFWFAPLEVAAWTSRLQNVTFSPVRPFDQSMNWFFAQP